jgi:hypothetical protein
MSNPESCVVFNRTGSERGTCWHSMLQRAQHSQQANNGVDPQKREKHGENCPRTGQSTEASLDGPGTKGTNSESIRIGIPS